MSVKEVEKVSKSLYRLKIEIARIWKMETETIPVVIGALGVIKRELEKYVDKIPGTASINELQKNYSSGNSSHPQKGSVNQVNCSVSKDHGLVPVLQRLNEKVKDYK